MSIGRPDGTRGEMSLWGWGDPARAEPLTEALRSLLRTPGIGSGSAAPRALDSMPLPAARMANEIRSELAAIVGARHAHSDDTDEAETALGPARPGEIAPVGTSRPAGCLAIVGWEGARADVSERRTATAEVGAVKRAIDPTEILNPGIVLPTSGKTQPDDSPDPSEVP